MIKHMYVGGFLMALGCCSIATGCAFGPKVKVEEPFSLSHAFAGQQLHVKWKNGPITVNVSDAVSELTASGMIYASARTDERANLLLDAFEVTIDETNDVVTIVANTPKSGNNESCGGNLEITIPTSAMLDLHSSNGKINVTGNQALTKMKSTNGRLTIKEQSGDVDAKTSNGKVVVESDGGSIRVDTSNGAVNITAHSMGIGEVDVNTSNGKIRLDVPCSLGADVQARTSNGSVSVDIPALKINSSKRKSNFQGTLNGGGIPIKLKSSNGAITISCEDESA